MKKQIGMITILCLIIGLIAVFSQRVTTVQNVVDASIDKNGNFYYICMNKGNTKYFVISVDKNGKLLSQIDLPFQQNGILCEYTEIVADDKNGFYLLEGEMDQAGKYIAQRLYYFDESKAKTEVYKLDNTTEKNKGKILSSLQFLDGTMSVFITGEALEATMLQCLSKTNEIWEITYRFESPMDIKSILNDGKEGVYFTDSHSKLYFMNQSGSLEEIVKDKIVIPYVMSIDKQKNILFFTDAHGFRFQKYSPKNKNTETVYLKEDFITDGICFKHIRDMKFENGFLMGYSPVFEKENSFLFAKNGEQTILVEHILKGPAQLLKWGMVWFFGFFMLLLFLTVLFYIWRHSRRIMVKMTIVLLSLLIGLAVAVSGLIHTSVAETLTNEIFSQLYLISSSVSKSIDGDELNNISFPQSKGDEYYEKIAAKVNLNVDAIYKAEPNAISKYYYYTLYYIKEEEPYIGFDIVEEGGTIISGMAESYQVAPQNYSIFQKNQKEGKATFFSSTDLSGTWMACPTMIYDSKGEAVGYFEIGTDQNVVQKSMGEIFKKITLLASVLIVIIIFLLLLILRQFLNGIGRLRSGVEAISEGGWGALVDIESRDEIEDIGNAFNKMSRHVKRYLNSIVKLNQYCERFVPSDFFKFIGKENIMDVCVGDEKNQNVNLMSISTSFFDDNSFEMTSHQKFKLLNDIFAIMAGVIRQSGGFIEDYYGAGLRAVFAQSADNAVAAALSILEKMDGYNAQNGIDILLNITIQNGDIMFGIVGDENRMGTTILSEIVNRIHIMNQFAERNNMGLLISGDVYNKLSKQSHYDFRHIGKYQFSENEGDKPALYDCLNAYDYETKKTRLLSKQSFEMGVAEFEKGELIGSRKHFIDAIRIDREDELTKVYIFLCDKYLKNRESFRGTLS